MSACDHTRGLLPRALAEDLTEAERGAFSEHLSGCEACRGAEETLRRDLALAAPEDLEPPTELWSAIAESLSQIEGAEGEAVKAERSQHSGAVAVRCLYCKGGLDTAAAVYCARCLSTYHEDCFAEHGACSVFGCEERRVVRPLEPESFAPLRVPTGKDKNGAAPRRGPSRWLPTLALAVGISAAGSIAAWRYTSPETAVAVAVPRAQDASPAPKPKPAPKPAAVKKRPEKKKPARFDHGELDRLLKTYVDDEGLVNYTRWKASPADLKALDDYLAAIARTRSTSLPRKERIAFLINLYNAWTLKKLLDSYPLASILDLADKDPRAGIWDGAFVLLDGEKVSLNHIEKTILLKQIKEPRIHFAVVPGALGAPPLLNAAWTGEELEALFEQQARAYLFYADNFRFDAKTNTVYLSKLFDWYREDFAAEKGLIQMKRDSRLVIGLSRYVDDPQARVSMAAGSAALAFLDFDWGLNDQSVSAPPKPAPKVKPKKPEAEPKAKKVEPKPAERKPWPKLGTRPASLQRGDTYFRSGYYVKAAEEYRKVLLKDKTEPLPQLAFAAALFSMGNYHYAAHSLRRALRRWPEDKPLDTTLQALFPAELSFIRAFDDLKRYARFNRRDPSALTVLAYVYFAVGDYDQAKTICGYLRILDKGDEVAAALEPRIERLTGAKEKK